MRAPAARPAAELRALVERTVGGMGYELVELERAAQGLVRVTLDRAEGAPGSAIGLDDCERVSRQLTHLFAVEDIAFERLEVSSPGLDRPLTAARDYRRFAGLPVHVHLRAPLNGRRRWKGVLLGLEGAEGAETVRLAVEPEGARDKAEGPAARRKPAPKAKAARKAEQQEPAQTVDLPLSEIEKARLVPQIDFGGPARARKEEPR